MTDPTTHQAPDRFNFVVSGTSYNVATELVEELLADIGMVLHSVDPLQVIDKVGFLKTGDDAKEIIADLLSKYVDAVNQDAIAETTNWPFPVAGKQSVLDFDGLDGGDDCYSDLMNADRD